MSLLAWLNDRIKRATPCAAENVDRGCWIRASSYCPDNFIDIGDIDIFIDNNHVPSQIGTGMTLRSHQGSLLCVAGITLLDSYNNHEPLRRGRQIDTANVRHPGLFHAVPHGSGAQAGTIHTVNRRLERSRTANNWIISIVQRLYAHKRLGAPSAGVI